MNELNVVVNATQGEITFNLDNLKQSLSAEMETYKSLVVTEDTVKDSKKDLAMLRKVRKELNDKKIEIKKTFMKPYTDFETEVKEALAIIDEPIELIDSQVKGFEEEKKKAKKEHLHELWEEKVGDLAEYLTFERVYRDDWLKASFKDEDVVSEIETQIIHINNDLSAIKALNSEIEETLLTVYKNTGLLANAIQKSTDYIETKALAREKVQEETKIYEDKSVSPIDTSIVWLGFAKNDIERVKTALDFAGIEYKEK